jgi:hypothetical protein
MIMYYLGYLVFAFLMEVGSALCCMIILVITSSASLRANVSCPDLAKLLHYVDNTCSEL